MPNEPSSQNTSFQLHLPTSVPPRAVPTALLPACDLSERTAPDGPHFTEALSVAILSEHFEVAKYFVDKGYRLDRPYNWQIPYRVVSGNLAMIKWLRTHQLAGDRTPWLEDAASAGHLDIVKWIHVNMPEDTSTKEAMNGAASGGHLEVVKWLHENRSEGSSKRAMTGAATNAHLEVVDWLHEYRREHCAMWGSTALPRTATWRW
ncbi:hypothetical protein PybrP1_005387 [[Pythium] brassicae (nom. inval.)]|nr:hypothetical protein PybrP1_005387 [[Pythium] brassicae (nom. inval.)]